MRACWPRRRRARPGSRSCERSAPVPFRAMSRAAGGSRSDATAVGAGRRAGTAAEAGGHARHAQGGPAREERSLDRRSFRHAAPVCMCRRARDADCAAATATPHAESSLPQSSNTRASSTQTRSDALSRAVSLPAVAIVSSSARRGAALSVDLAKHNVERADDGDHVRNHVPLADQV